MSDEVEVRRVNPDEFEKPRRQRQGTLPLRQLAVGEALVVPAGDPRKPDQLRSLASMAGQRLKRRFRVVVNPGEVLIVRLQDKAPAVAPEVDHGQA